MAEENLMTLRYADVAEDVAHVPKDLVYHKCKSTHHLAVHSKMSQDLSHPSIFGFNMTS